LAKPRRKPAASAAATRTRTNHGATPRATPRRDATLPGALNIGRCSDGIVPAVAPPGGTTATSTGRGGSDIRPARCALASVPPGPFDGPSGAPGGALVCPCAAAVGGAIGLLLAIGDGASGAKTLGTSGKRLSGWTFTCTCPCAP